MGNFAILILAAGSSSRMGRVKQLLPWKGATLIENAIRQAENSHAARVVVVLGANSEMIKNKVTTKRALFLDNNNWEAGMGTSIACGIDYVSELMENLDGVLIMLADQPLIDTAYLNEMLIHFESSSKNIAATKYKNRVGVPAIFSPVYFRELATLEDDFGAKNILENYKNDVFSIEAQEKTLDIDRQEDFDRLKDSDL